MKDVRDAIQVFLEGDAYRSLLISGDWGTGKTHLTLEALEAWKNRDTSDKSPANSKRQNWFSGLRAPTVAKRDTNKWLHISLYGKKSTAEIDSALAIAYVTSKAEKIPFSDNLKHVAPFLGNSESSGVLSHFAKQFGKSHVLLLDDLERKAESLALSDVIAYVDVFINTYGGKVICIINTDRLTPEEQEWLLNNAEKTFPRRIRLQPTIDDVESIVAAQRAESDATALEFIKMLEITNIRIAREIMANAREYMTIAAPPDAADPHITSEIITVCIATASVAGLKEFPTAAFLLGPMSEILLGQDKISDEEKAWQKRLSLVDYRYTDQLDKEIIQQVERGYFSAASLKARRVEQKKEEDSPLHKAWTVFHDSIDGDTDAFVRQFVEAARKSFLVTSISNMNSTVRLLRLLDKPDLADQIGSEYAEARMVLPPVALDHSEDHFFDTDDKDANFLNALDVKLREKTASMDLNETLVEGAEARHFDRYRTQRLAQATPQQLADAIRSADNDVRNRIVKTCLEMSRYIDDADKALVVENTKSALKLIAKDSKVNKVRFARKFGIEIE